LERMLTREETGDWVAGSKKANAQLFSELDVLLQALERFFTPANFTGSGEDLTSRNFYEELVTARDGILRILGILEVIIPESRKNAYWFQKYAETKLTTARSRDAFRESLYRQNSPEKGLYLLYDSFINLKGVLSDLLGSTGISYMGFMNMGNLISKEIRENNFFNPFARSPNPEFDTISNPEISDIVKSLKQKEVKKYVSVMYLYLFRLLRFMSFMDIDTQRAVALHSSLLIVLLLKYEIASLQAHIEKAVKKIKDPGLEDLLGSLSYQFAMESRRVYIQELRDIHHQDAVFARGKIENSQGILRNLTEQSIVHLAKFFRPGADGEEIFPNFVTRFQQSLKLREDIGALHRFLVLLEASTVSGRERGKVFESLRSYMVYFESFTFRMLRHDDYEEFERFFTMLNGMESGLVQGQGFEKIVEMIRQFRVFLETVLIQIGNRAELRDHPLDGRAVEELVRKHL